MFGLSNTVLSSTSASDCRRMISDHAPAKFHSPSQYACRATVWAATATENYVIDHMPRLGGGICNRGAAGGV